MEENLAGKCLVERYRLDRLIATGGMAQVWQGTDLVLNREVAVKVLHSHLATNERFVERFRQEAVAAARLAHPSIVAIFDTCSEDGIEAIVMELVRGTTLRAHLDSQGNLDPHQVVRIGSHVADALEQAHKAGLIHRDIKPANILLCDDQRVMVTDFGIAKSDIGADLTQDGTMLGTAKYLAPEQVNNHRITARSDLYSLGIVLYESLTGRPPFQGDSDLATAMARLHTEPLKPRQIRPSIPRTIEAVVLQAMEMDPAQRQESAADLRRDLLAADPGPDATGRLTEPDIAVGAPTFTQSESGWLLPTLAVVLIAVALGVAGVLLGRTETGQEIVERALDVVGSETSDEDTVDPAPVAPLAIAAVTSFDPQTTDGDPTERNDLVANLIDGDETTFWRTEGYADRRFGRLKDGVGLIVTLDRSAEIDSFTVNSPTQGWSAELHLGAGTEVNLEDWGAATASVSEAQGAHRFELDGAQTSTILLWITDLGEGPLNESSRLHLTISELEAS